MNNPFSKKALTEKQKYKARKVRDWPSWDYMVGNYDGHQQCKEDLRALLETEIEKFEKDEYRIEEGDRIFGELGEDCGYDEYGADVKKLVLEELLAELKGETEITEKKKNVLSKLIITTEEKRLLEEIDKLRTANSVLQEKVSNLKSHYSDKGKLTLAQQKVIYISDQWNKKIYTADFAMNEIYKLFRLYKHRKEEQK